MKLCLRCRSFWARDAVYCGRCRLPLGVKKCPQSHSNPLRTPGQTCLVCNEGPLTEGVPYLSFGAIPVLSTLLFLWMVWRLVSMYFGWVVCTLWYSGMWVLGLLFGVAPVRVETTIAQSLVWYGMLWLLSYCLPAASARWLRQVLGRLPQRIWRLLESVGRTLRRLVLRSGAAGNANTSGSKHQK